jgi:hypothetical protein
VGDGVPGGSGSELRVGRLVPGYRSFHICPNLSLRSVIDGGSPRACLAWPGPRRPARTMRGVPPPELVTHHRP